MGYREIVLDKAEKDPTHPAYYGIKMQVNHLLSQSGFVKSKKDEELISYGYDINVLDNLVALPCDMDAACYLKVQVHRGNHPKFIDNDDDSDDVHPKTYHQHVAGVIRNATKKLEDKCATGNEKTVRKYLALYSRGILDKIGDFEIPVTKPYEAFQDGGPGCGGETSTKILFTKMKSGNNNRCDRDKDHSKYSDFNQVPYKLKVGR